jgi:hypothetical protein
MSEPCKQGVFAQEALSRFPVIKGLNVLVYPVKEFSIVPEENQMFRYRRMKMLPRSLAGYPGGQFANAPRLTPLIRTAQPFPCGHPDLRVR